MGYRYVLVHAKTTFTLYYDNQVVDATYLVLSFVDAMYACCNLSLLSCSYIQQNVFINYKFTKLSITKIILTFNSFIWKWYLVMWSYSYRISWHTRTSSMHGQLSTHDYTMGFFAIIHHKKLLWYVDLSFYILYSDRLRGFFSLQLHLLPILYQTKNDDTHSGL